MFRFICLRYICYTLIFELEWVCFLGAKITLINLILFMHSVFHWLDIKYAFFHEILRMKYLWSKEQLPGFVAQWESIGFVYRFCQSLYGLNQSVRVWFCMFSTIMQKQHNSSLYFCAQLVPCSESTYLLW